MISMVFRTRRSPSSSRRGRRVRALENSVQTGDAQIKSKCPGGYVLQSHSRMSAQMEGRVVASASRLVNGRADSFGRRHFYVT